MYRDAMVQITYGIGSGPNGMQVMPIIVPGAPSEPAKPQSYVSNFETPEGVTINVTYNTGDQAQADRYQEEILEKTGWSRLPDNLTGPESLASKIASMWITAVVFPLIIGICACVGAIVFHMAGWGSYAVSELVLQTSLYYGLWSVPILGFLLTAVVLFKHSPGE